MKTYIKNIDGLSVEMLISDGQGAPIFLFHGNSSNALTYAPLLSSELGKKYRLISVSLPGHGGSEYPDTWNETLSIEAIGAFTLSVINYFEAKNYLLIGQSLGGHALLEVLHLHKGAKGICLISAPPFNLDTIADAFLEDPTQGLLFKKDLSFDEVRRFAAAFISVAPEKDITALEDAITSTKGDFREALGRSLGRGEVKDEIKSIVDCHIPTHVLQGLNDQFICGDYYESLLQKGLPIDLQRFQNAGHAIQLDAPQAFSEAIEAFITKYHRQPVSRPVVGKRLSHA